MNVSLRKRFGMVVAATSLCTWVILAAWLYVQVHREVDVMFDHHLAEAAGILAGLTGSEAIEYAPHGHDSALAFDRFMAAELRMHLSTGTYPKSQTYEIAVGDPPRVLDAGGGQEIPWPDHGRPGYHDLLVDARPWRAFTAVAPGTGVGPIRVRVGEPLSVRDDVVHRIAKVLGIPIAFSLGLMLWLMWWGIRWGLRPLSGLTAEVARRSSTDLDPLPAAAAPAETRPLVSALNFLLARLDNALTSERSFTANAAHELRTPLAGIRTQAQVAQRARDPVERDKALDQIAKGIERATHVVEQMLNLARLDPVNSSAPASLLVVREIVDEVIEELNALAGGRDVTLLNEVPGHCHFFCHRDALRIALRNLIDNGIRHGRVGGRVRVGLVLTNAGGLLVEDDGPGVADEAMPLLGKRFSRVPGTRAAGSGLGLAIVVRIAELHGGRLLLRRSDLGGLAAEIYCAPAGAGDGA